MTNAILMLLVPTTVVLALAIDLGVALAWLRRRTRPRGGVLEGLAEGVSSKIGKSAFRAKQATVEIKPESWAGGGDPLWPVPGLPPRPRRVPRC